MTFASEKIRAFSVGDRVNLVSSKTRGDTTHHVETSFPKDDAPAVALAILEAAGVTDFYANRAIGHLRQNEKERAEKAEREVEDAKVNDFRNATCADDWTCWDEVPEDVKETLRIQYHAARKFFEGS